MIVALPHTPKPQHLVITVSVVQAWMEASVWGSQSLYCLVYLRLWASCCYVQDRVPVYGFCFLLMCPINAIWSVRWKRPNHVFDAVPGLWQSMCLFSQCLWYGCTSLPASKGVSYRQVPFWELNLYGGSHLGTQDISYQVYSIPTQSHLLRMGLGSPDV